MSGEASADFGPAPFAKPEIRKDTAPQALTKLSVDDQQPLLAAPAPESIPIFRPQGAPGLKPSPATVQAPLLRSGVVAPRMPSPAPRSNAAPPAGLAPRIGDWVKQREAPQFETPPQRETPQRETPPHSEAANRLPAAERIARQQPPAGESLAAAPFQVIGESGTIDVKIGRSKLLRMKFPVYRTAVVDPTICDVVQYTPEEVAIIGKGYGSTHITFWFEGDEGPMTYLFKVAPDESAREDVEAEYHLLEDILAEHFPDSKVHLFPVADKLFVKGQAKDVEEAAHILAIVRSHTGDSTGQSSGSAGGFGSVRGGSAARVFAVGEAGNNDRPEIQVINMLKVPGVQQVALRVKIAELNRTSARGFGIDVNANISIEGNEGSLLIQSLLNAASGNAPALLARFDRNAIQIGLRNLQQHGVLRLLSEPTLVTMSGQPATFVAGGEFAVPTIVGNAGLNAVTTDFRAFGAIISFLPTVVDKDRIRLQVAPEFSQINNNLSVGGTPGLDVRSVTTTVEMREGQTLAIAGLLDDNMRASLTANLPMFPKLFGSRDVTRTETELIILVTPELVHPMEPDEVPPLPGFDVTEPTDWQFYMKAKLEGNPTWDHRSTIWPRLRRRYGAGGPAMISGPFGHGN